MKKRILSFLSFILYGSIQSIKAFFAPHDTCIYNYTCSRYAVDTLQNTFILIALLKIIIRVLSCNPLTPYLIHTYQIPVSKVHQLKKW